MGRPSVAPGVYFRLLLIGYFEGIDSERASPGDAPIRWACRAFWDTRLTEATPDHSTMSRTRRLIDVETHGRCSRGCCRCWRSMACSKGKTIGSRCDDAGGECGDAEHRAARHGRKLSASF